MSGSGSDSHLKYSTLCDDWGLLSPLSKVVGQPIVGDGILTYPGVNDMIPSLRLANIRDGLEDNQYLAEFASRPSWSREIVTATFGEKVGAADKAHPTFDMMNGARTGSVEVSAGSCRSYRAQLS